MKANEYTSRVVNSYFWRTYDRKEIDLVEEKKGKLNGYEIKWQPKKIKIPSDWKNAYTNASFDVIDQQNYLNFIQHSI
jgi:hypothetical protein